MDLRVKLHPREVFTCYDRYTGLEYERVHYKGSIEPVWYGVVIHQETGNRFYMEEHDKERTDALEAFYTSSTTR